VRTGIERHELQRDVRPLGHLEQMQQLPTLDFLITRASPQRSLVQHHPQVGRPRLVQERLPGYPQRDATLDLAVRHVQVAQPHEGAGIVLGLQQPGHQLGLVDAEDRRGLLQTDIGLEPARQHVTVLAPPTGCVGLPGEGEQSLAFLRVGDAIEGEQIGHITFLGRDPAAFETADLTAGGANGVSGGVPGDPAGLAQSP
jgi:hypothetical protein